jgi:hypothetical protein
MIKEGATIPFLVSYSSGKSETMEAIDINDLIAAHFKTENEFKELVNKVQWKKKTTQCIYDVTIGHTEHKISDGDINPYGWRQKHK